MVYNNKVNIIDEVIMDITKIDKKQQTAAQKGIINLYDIVSVLVTAVVTIAILFTFIFRVVGVVGTSMVPTLHDGDWLAVTAFDSKPAYGQVVIVTQPNAFNEPIVKRIIATEGQTVDIDFDKGEVYVDGKQLDEPYINEKTHDYEGVEEQITRVVVVDFPVTVPDGCVFVMGDNRNGSTDSRSPMVGFINENYLLGVAKFKIITAEDGKPKFNSFKDWKIN